MTESKAKKDNENASKEAAVKSSKPSRKRIPLGTRNILTAPKKPGFVRRFVNDKGDRIENFKAAGWTTVDEKTQVGDSKIGRADSMGSSVNPHVGGGQRAVLMELPEEIYKEDRAASQAQITKIENEIKRNQLRQDGLEGKVSIS